MCLCWLGKIVIITIPVSLLTAWRFHFSSKFLTYPWFFARYSYLRKINLVLYFVYIRSFRLQAKRLLKNLMIMDHGCSQATPGIGNIAYVKDLRTEKIVTAKFRCSVFGSYHDPATGSGWVIIICEIYRI